MNKRVSQSLAVLLLLAITAFGSGQKASAASPTLQVSCHTCSNTDVITYSGHGFKARSTVILDIHGTASYSISTVTDSNGNLYVSYGTVLSYPAGSYTVTASAVSGRSATLVATDFFDIQ
jgi:hypothetical protein